MVARRLTHPLVLVRKAERRRVVGASIGLHEEGEERLELVEQVVLLVGGARVGGEDRVAELRDHEELVKEIEHNNMTKAGNVYK